MPLGREMHAVDAVDLHDRGGVQERHPGGIGQVAVDRPKLPGLGARLGAEHCPERPVHHVGRNRRRRQQQNMGRRVLGAVMPADVSIMAASRTALRPTSSGVRWFSSRKSLVPSATMTRSSGIWLPMAAGR